MKNIKILKNFFINFMKLVLFSVHLFSRTPFFFIFTIALIIGVFYEESNNFLAYICYFFVSFYILTSFILLILLNIKQSFSFISELVGSSFLEKYYPISKKGLRGFRPFVVFFSTLCAFSVVDYCSLAFLDYLDYQEVDRMREKMVDLYKDGNILEGRKQQESTVRRTNRILENRGIVSQLANNKLIQNFLDNFNIK